MLKILFSHSSKQIANAIYCENKIGDNSVKQIERARCNLYSRYDLLIMALNDIHRQYYSY